MHICKYMGLSDIKEIHIRTWCYCLTGSFKMRGVVSKFSSLEGSERALISMSGGN